MNTTAPADVSRRRWRHDGALLLLRTAAAGPLFFHGAQKLFGWFGGSGLAGFGAWLEHLGMPFPKALAVLAAVSEVGGAVMLGAGLGFGALAPVVFTMLVAAGTSARNGYDVLHGGAEYPLTLALLVGALALLGPGAYSARRTS